MKYPSELHKQHTSILEGIAFLPRWHYDGNGNIIITSYDIFKFPEERTVSIKVFENVAHQLTKDKND